MASRPSAEKAGTGTAVGSAAAAAPQSETNEDAALRHLLDAIMAAKDGDFTVRLSVDEPGVLGEICAAYNDLVRTTMAEVRSDREIDRAHILRRLEDWRDRTPLRHPHAYWSHRCGQLV
jgi:hypothetical protein